MDAEVLDLRLTEYPEVVYSPDLIEADVMLEFVAGDFESGSDFNIEDGVAWTASVLEESTEITWTVFPSTGLLFPGQR